MFNDFFRVAAASPVVSLADCRANADAIIAFAEKFSEQGVDLAVFPEMSLTGYTCGDLFHNTTLLEASQRELDRITCATSSLKTALIVGAPVVLDNTMYNCGIAIQGGKIRMVVPKSYIPNYGEFYEKRWFATPSIDLMAEVDLCGGKYRAVPFGQRQILEISGVRVGIEICEDLWAPIPPSSRLAMAGAQIVANLSASDSVVGKYTYLCELIKQQSARAICGYVYASAGFGESSGDLVFDGKAIVAENGWIAARNNRWQMESSSVVADIDIEVIDHDRNFKSSFADCAANENARGYKIVKCDGGFIDSDNRTLLRSVDPMPFVETGGEADFQCAEVVNIQIAGLARRLKATGCKSVVVGISGGLDSTLALLVACKTFDRLGIDRKNITAVTMPGFGTSDRTYFNAVALMTKLGVGMREISIVPAVTQHLKDIGHDISVHDTTYENAQARQRTYLLMDIANQTGGMVLGTGDLSEIALGWATYNGDHMSMYSINNDVPKTLIRNIVRWFAKAQEFEAIAANLIDVVETPVSPELVPGNSKDKIAQVTEDLVGPYELHDFFLFHFIRFGRSPRKIFFLAKIAFNGKFSEEVILKWLKTFCRRFFNQQFKRSCTPDGPKVGSVALSPRGDWRMPSDALSAEWLREVEEIEKQLNS